MINRPFSSFTYLNVTQFLGALNDNVYKLLIVFFLIQLQGIENSHTILSLTGGIFVLPFLLFSTSCGTLADRCSKRNIIVLTKILEFATMSIGAVAFRYESVAGSYFVLFMMATQSAIFGPSKYGIIPELVSSEKIPKANGLMTSFTFLAIILGTFLASFILDVTDKDFIVASLFSVVVSLVGVVTSFYIEYTPPSGSIKKLNPDILEEIRNTLRIAKGETSLRAAIFGSAFFLFVAAYVQLNIIPFAVESLHLTDVQGGYLFLLTALGIGMGSIIAGKISGKIVELGLVPLAGIGLSGMLFLLDLSSSNFLFCIPIVVILGILGGMFEIPLDSYIQVASPSQYRGQIVAATNFFSFFGVLVASGLLFLTNEVFHLKADKGFVVIGTLACLVSLIFGYLFFDYTTRFIAMVLSKLHFKTKLSGVNHLPDSPAIFVCTHTAWNDTLLILGAQRRRVRFFIEKEYQHQNIWLYRLYRMLRIVRIPSIEPLENNYVCLATIKATLNRGISVCIFTSNEDVIQEIETLKNSYHFQEIMEETNDPIIPIWIEKGEKEREPAFFTRLLKKFRVPATIAFGQTPLET